MLTLTLLLLGCTSVSGSAQRAQVSESAVSTSTVCPAGLPPRLPTLPTCLPWAPGLPLVENSWSPGGGVGGPGLTTNAFNASITNLETTVNNVATQRLDFQCAPAERSFTEKHGDALAQRMHRLCNVANNDHPPKALRLLAKSTTKSHDCAILGNLFREQAQASFVPLTASQLPLATTKLVDDVFLTSRLPAQALCSPVASPCLPLCARDTQKPLRTCNS